MQARHCIDLDSWGLCEAIGMVMVDSKLRDQKGLNKTKVGDC